jgi:hypothetical protein
VWLLTSAPGSALPNCGFAPPAPAPIARVLHHLPLGEGLLTLAKHLRSVEDPPVPERGRNEVEGVAEAAPTL